MRHRYALGLSLTALLMGGSGADAQRGAPRWPITETGRFERKTYPAGTTADMSFARREAGTLATRWKPAARLFKIDVRSTPPVQTSSAGRLGMFEAYLYYFVPESDPTKWQGLLVSAGLMYGEDAFHLTSSTFTSTPPIPIAALADLVDPTEALRRLKLAPQDFFKDGVHLKAAGHPIMTAINFGLTGGEFERYLDRTLPAGQWIWWTELHPGTGNNTFVYIDAATGHGTIVPRLR